MTPGMRPGTTLPFYELGALPFQALCRDLLNVEPDIATAEVYGVSGEPQDGIDVLATRRSDSRIELGQCKCYQEFSPADIRKASDEFFKYWDARWSKEGVQRFILFVACDLSRRSCQDEILKQTQRFRAMGVQYEAWSADKIRIKLGPHPYIVSAHLTPVDHWIQVICGRTLTPFPVATEKTSLLVSSSLLSDLELFRTHVSSTTEKELERAREFLREGQYTEAAAWVRSKKSDRALWIKLESPIKAKILRFEAALAIHGPGGIQEAHALANEARALSPADDLTRLSALIAYAEHRTTDAIELLRKSTTPENRELCAAFLIETGHLDDAWEILEKDELKSRADSLRLRSLVHLFKGRIELAKRDVQEALQLSPRWESTRLTAAVIDYYSALSPSALTGARLWPDPISWKLVQRDDGSLAKLRNSAQVFKELLATASRPTEQSTLETWYLACMMNDAERQENALAFCKQLLERTPGHVGALLWAAARNLELSLEPSIVDLEQHIAGSRAALPEILALTNVYLSRNQADAALAVLERTRPLFEKENAAHAWHFWRAQSLISADRLEEAMKSAEELHHPQLATNIRLSVLHKRMHTDEGLKQLVALLEECLASTEDMAYLLEACTVMATQGKWAYVADRAENLVESIGTLDALHLAVTSTYNNKRFEQCLLLLNKHRNLLPHGQLTGELRRLRFECHQHLGGLPEALLECEALVQEDPSLENHLRLASTLVSVGDLERLALTARDIERHPDLTATYALQLAFTLRPYNPERSAELVHRAIALGVSDDDVGPALSLSLQLGLKSIERELILRMHALAQKGERHFRAINLSELRDHQLEYRKRAAQFDDLYRKGELPIHMYAEWARKPLAALFHSLLRSNETQPNPDRQPALLIRSGRFPLPSSSGEQPDWKLWLDVTAILLAAHLNILDEVEKTFRPLWIPPSLIHSLIEMRAAMEHPQPYRLRAQQKIADMVMQGMLKLAQHKSPTNRFEPTLEQELGTPWLHLFEQARSKNGYLVDFLPVRKRTLDSGLATLPEGAKHVVASCWSVLEALNHQGAISKGTHQAALDTLGTLGERDEGVVPSAGHPLFFREGVLDLLIEANVIEALLAHFDVYIEPITLESAQEALQHDAQRQETGRWLDGLISRIRRGLENKTYSRLPIPVAEHDDDSEDDDSEQERHVGFAGNCLLELFKLKPPVGTVLWIDDRRMHAYGGTDQASIVGVVEVLSAMVRAKTLTSERYFEVLSRLRAANAWFIPLSKSEILPALRRARVHQGQVIETSELVSLRRSFSASLSKSNMLQSPAKMGGTGELAFIHESSTAIREAIIELWESTSDPEADRVRADWLLLEMHFGPSGVARSLEPGFPASKLALTEISSALDLILSAIDLPAAFRADVPSTRREYLEWLSHRLLTQLWTDEPSWLIDMADQFKHRMQSALHAQTSDETREFLAAYLSRFIDDLPKTLRKEIDRDATFINSIKRHVFTVVSVMGQIFPEATFWDAAEQAVNGGEASIQTVGDQPVAVLPGNSSLQEPAIALNIPGKNPTLLKDFALGALLRPPTARKAFLEARRPLLDTTENIVQQLCDESFSQLPPVERMRQFVSIAESSAGFFYNKLHHQLREQESFRLSQLLPITGEMLAQHYRIPFSPDAGDTTFTATLETATAMLAREVGLEAALLRLMALPVPLPATIIRSVAELSSSARLQMFHSLLRADGSPVSRWHLIRLLWAYRNEHAPYRRCALRRISRELRGHDKGEFDLFTTLLSWTWAKLLQQKDAERCSPQLRLALVWVHAHHLFAIFRAPETDYKRLILIFEGEIFQSMGRAIGKSASEQFDAVHPHQVSRLSFTLSCLSYALDNSPSSEFGPIHGLALSTSFPKQSSEGILVPHLDLFHDVSLAKNSLDSFLGGDRGVQLAPLFGSEQAAPLERGNLEQFCSRVLKDLKAGDHVLFHWGMLRHITRGLPIYPALVPQLDEIIVSLDIASVLERDCQQGLFILQSACEQSRSPLSEAARLHLLAQWRVAVSFLAREQETETPGHSLHANPRQLVVQLIGTLLFAIEALPIGEQLVSELSQQLSHLAAVPSFRATGALKLILEQISSGLPFSARMDLWAIRMLVRSAQPGPLPPRE